MHSQCVTYNRRQSQFGEADRNLARKQGYALLWTWVSRKMCFSHLTFLSGLQRNTCALHNWV